MGPVSRYRIRFKWNTLVIIAVAFALAMASCTTERSVSVRCTRASCITYQGIELSISHVETNYILPVASLSGFYADSASNDAAPVDTSPLPTINGTPPKPTETAPGAQTNPSTTRPPPARVTVPRAIPSFHYVRVQLLFENGSGRRVKVNPADVWVKDPTGTPRGPVREPQCDGGKSRVLSPGGRLGPVDSCFMVAGPMDGRVVVVWPWPRGASVALP